MNIFAKFDENPAITLQVIKKTKRYGRMDGRTDRRMDNVKTVYPTTNKVCGGYKKSVFGVTGLKILGRAGTHIFFILFLWKKYNFMHFERQTAFQNP